MIGTIYVYGDWADLSTPVLIGKLNVDILRGKEVFSFGYDEKWLDSPNKIFIDPDLLLFGGRQYPPANKSLFGVFTDSCPDRWGRTLLQRKEAIEARLEKRAPRKLYESDYLIGIEDFSRMGALRFKRDPNGPFLAESDENSVPIWTSIRELEQAAILLDASSDIDKKTAKRLELLLKPGSSLGGARPKASVRDTEGNLWIAKFASRQDEYDVGAWEMVAHELAVKCGLRVPKALSKRYSNYGTTFLVERFDRDARGKRKHFVSAMTMLGASDGAEYDIGTSYLDIAYAIKQYGISPAIDLKELWKRIVFSIAITNTDDHLRNHGFIVEKGGIRLSPLYDVNPNPNGTGLALNIDEFDNSLDFEVAINASEYFGLTKDEASKEVKAMKENIGLWRSIASRVGISHSEINAMESCFRL